MVEKLTNYDPVEDLGSDESIAIFMAEAFETNDVGYISHALGVVARAEKETLLLKTTLVVHECYGHPTDHQDSYCCMI